jgi:hypothetical protein
MPWIITKDHIAEKDAEPGTNCNAVGVIGPSSTKKTKEEILAHPEKQFFQMFDDDGVLYYDGFMVFSKNSSGFEPLDDFGCPNAGCTMIKYKDEKTGEMKQL